MCTGFVFAPDCCLRKGRGWPRFAFFATSFFLAGKPPYPRLLLIRRTRARSSAARSLCNVAERAERAERARRSCASAREAYDARRLPKLFPRGCNAPVVCSIIAPVTPPTTAFVAKPFAKAPCNARLLGSTRARALHSVSVVCERGGEPCRTYGGFAQYQHRLRGKRQIEIICISNPLNGSPNCA